MKAWRILASAAAGTALAATLAVAPASAAPAPARKPGVANVYVAPPAPAGAGTTGSFRTLAAPSVSPSVSYQTAPPGGTYSCANGTLCTGIYDAGSGQWYIFKLYYCNTYSLSNWNSTNGFYLNKQTSGTRSDFFDQSWNVKTTIYAPSNGQVSYDYLPIWYITNC